MHSTCFITCFTLVSVSSTTRLTPKAPGFSQSKIYRREREKLSGNVHIFPLSKACLPPISLLALLTSPVCWQSERLCFVLQTKETARKAGEPCEGRTRAHLFEDDSGAFHHPMPLLQSVVRTSGHLGANTSGAEGVFTPSSPLDPNFQYPPPSWASKQERNWCITDIIIVTATCVPGTCQALYSQPCRQHYCCLHAYTEDTEARGARSVSEATAGATEMAWTGLEPQGLTPEPAHPAKSAERRLPRLDSAQGGQGYLRITFI